jgi:lipopolysaccharide/colanic/teichoic acid biosynthesis glycosyltransferase
MALRSHDLSAVARAADSFCALCLTGAAIYISGPHHHTATIVVQSRMVIAYFMCAMLFALIWNECAGAAGLYLLHPRPVQWTLIRAAKASAVMASVLAPILMLLPPAWRRPQPLAVSFALTFAYRVIACLIKHVAAGRPERVIILGSGRRAQRAWRELRVNQYNQVDFVGFVDDCANKDSLAPDIRERYLTEIEHLHAYLLHSPVDAMIVATSLRTQFDLTRNAIAIAKMFDIRVVGLEDSLELGHPRLQRREGPVFSHLTPTDEGYLCRRTMKHWIDKVIAITVLATLSPVLLLLCVLTGILTGGPLLMWELRYGYHRKPFRMLSLNTLFEPANKSRLRLGHPEVCARSIDRIRVSIARPYYQVLRAAHLDGLPRLWNVMAGDMSLVGPTPMSTPGVSPLLEPAWAEMFRARPGLFAPSSLLDEALRDLSRTMALDSSYVHDWTLRADARLVGQLALRWLGLGPVAPISWATAPPVGKSNSSA